MTIAWMLYAIVVGALIALAARAMESLARMAGRSVRWIWAAAIAATLLAVVIAPYRRAPAVQGPLTMTKIPSATSSAAVSSEPVWSRLTALASQGVTRAVVSVETSIARIQERVPPSAGRYVAAGWAVLAAAMLILFAVVHARFRRARRRWPAADLCGVRVRLSPDAGPAVLGFWRPEIVVPRWLLARSADEQRLALVHEVEHLRARDPLLLGVACAATALVPWNPAMWWMLSRLRLAVELDCDARVLRSGVVPYTYGSLLIAVAEHCSGLRLSVPALADDSSHLHQRLLAMKPRTIRFAFARRATIGAVGLLALIVACEAKLPTAVDIAAMDAASAEQAAKKLALVSDADSAVVYTIDGEAASAEVARKLTPAAIASIEVVKSKFTAGKSALISIKLHKAALAAGESGLMLGNDIGGQVRVRDAQPADGVLDRVVVRAHEALSGESSPTILKSANKSREFPGLLFINGTRATQSEVNALDMQRIESVEVIKGPAAIHTFGGAAALGVILIKTKPF